MPLTCRRTYELVLALFLAAAAPAMSQSPQPCPPPDAQPKESVGMRFQYYPTPTVAADAVCADDAVLLVLPADGVARAGASDPPEIALDSVPFAPDAFTASAWSSSLDIRPVLDHHNLAGFDWHAAFRESFLFLAVQHSFRLGFESDTRKKLDGKFFHEWAGSVASLSGWRDGDNFVTNYVAHPMQGAITGFIHVQNDSRGRAMTFTPNKEYFRNRTKALLWSAVWSTQFEIGPISEATLGNVGYKSQQKRYSSAAYVDLVITPTLGTALLVGEDAVDRYLISKWEERTQNRVVRAALRSFLNPSRSFANMMRGRWPWHRDTRSANP